MRNLFVCSLALAVVGGFALATIASAEEDLVIRKGKVVKAPADAAAKPAASAAKPAAKVESKDAKSKNAESKPRRAARRIAVTAAEGESLAAAWDVWYAAWNEQLPQDAAAAEAATADLQRDLRETARQLVAEENYDDAVAALQAALRNGTPSPWMYEALSVAMQAAGAKPADLERALMSAADLGAGGVDHYLYLAHYMNRVGLDRRALAMFREVAEIDPSNTDALVGALASAERLDDEEALRWASVAVLRQEWTNKERHIHEQALHQAQALLAKLRKDNPSEATAFQQELDAALARDLLVRVSWTGDADIDISVLEPSGTVCSFRQPRTMGGGVILGDTFSRDNVVAAEGYSETYVCPQAFSGQYQLMLRKIWGKVTSGQVKVEIIRHYGTKEAVPAVTELELADGTNAILFTIDDGRRTEPAQQVKVANAIREQAAVGRNLLAQQLGGVLDPRAIAAAQAARAATATAAGVGNVGGNNGVGGVLPIPIPIVQGAVGFRPVITTLPEGANLGASAVISADRRYVRITALPLFSKVGKVLAFNIITGQITNGNPDVGGGAGGGGAGGGGAGGGVAR